MKKLMTMIAAVAMSFGLFADGATPLPTNNSTNFSAATVGTTITTGNDTFWGWNGDAPITTAEAVVEEAVGGNNVLAIKTGAKTLSRKLIEDGTSYDVVSNVYFDTKIDLMGQVLEDFPTITDDAKIAIFAYDNINDADETTGKIVINQQSKDPWTALYAVAAAGDGSNGKWLYKLNYDIGQITNGLRRITVQAYKNILKGNIENAGFKLFIDGGEVAGTTPAVTISEAYAIDETTGKVTNWANLYDVDNYLNGLVIPQLNGVRDTLFRGLISGPEGQPLTAMDFIGNAKIANIAINESGFDFIAPDANSMGVDAGTGVTVGTITGGTLSDDKKTITVPAGTTPEITMTVDYPAGSVFKAYLDETKVAEANKVLTFNFAKDATLTLSAEAEAAKVFDVDGNPILDKDDYGFTDFAKALTAAQGSAGATLQLTQTRSEALEIECAGMTLDLAGNTITAEGSETAVIWVMSGELTITNSVPGQGGIYATAQEAGIAIANVVESGDEKISAAGVVNIVGNCTIDGLVQNFYETAPDTPTYEGIEATAGKFSVDPTAFVAEGYMVDSETDPDWYIVVPAPTTWEATVDLKVGIGVNVPTAKIDGKGDDVVIGEDGKVTVQADSTLVVTYTLQDGYKTDDDLVQTLTADAAESTAPVATIKTFTVTFVLDNGGENIVSNNVPYGTAFADVKPENPTKTGYNFTGWNPAGVPVTAEATYTAQYEAATYNITYKEADGTLITGLTPATYTFGVGATLPDTVDEKILGAAFDGWYDNQELSGTAVTAIGTDATGDKTFWAKVVSVTPAGEVEKKVDGNVDQNGKAVIDAIVAATGSDQTKVDAYITKVYGEGAKIPAADVNAADPDLVPASMYYGLPLMKEEPTVTVVAATAEEGAAAFTFTVNVNGKPADLVKAEAQKMVKYTTKLGDDTAPFHESIPTEVTITPATDGTMKAEFTAGEATAGFMKVDFTMSEQ